MIRRYGDRPKAGQQYRDRPGAYAIIMRGDEILTTYQQGDPLAQLPGGGVDVGETPMRALHREVMEETGYRIRIFRRLGVFQRYVYIDEYGYHARKVAHMFLAAPVRCVSAPLEKGHTAYWLPVEIALREIIIPGDRAFLQDFCTGRLG